MITATTAVRVTNGINNNPSDKNCTDRHYDFLSQYRQDDCAVFDPCRITVSRNFRMDMQKKSS